MWMASWSPGDYNLNRNSLFKISVPKSPIHAVNSLQFPLSPCCNPIFIDVSVLTYPLLLEVKFLEFNSFLSMQNFTRFSCVLGTDLILTVLSHQAPFCPLLTVTSSSVLWWHPFTFSLGSYYLSVAYLSVLSEVLEVTSHFLLQSERQTQYTIHTRVVIISVPVEWLKTEAHISCAEPPWPF